MTYARKALISLDDTRYYHVVARCVRRAWLWGFDEYAGKDYSHRKHWVLEKLKVLTESFSIQICAYAVMSNHYHLVLHVDVERAKAWSEAEVVERWTRGFRCPVMIDRYLRGECDTEAVREAASEVIEVWRRRLMDISWFMRMLNEHLARRANREDDCKGQFWEGRFRSQALLDEAGLLTAMAYVDLNPIRAGIASTPEESEFTSIYDRIQSMLPDQSNARSRFERDRRPALMRFGGSTPEPGREALPFDLLEYVQLVDWTGREIRPDKRGFIEKHEPPILTRLHVDVVVWRATMQRSGSLFGRALGQLDHLRLHAQQFQQSWIRGQRNCYQLYG